jgi:hypothetical protein
MAVFSQEKRHSQKITTSHHQGICSKTRDTLISLIHNVKAENLPRTDARMAAQANRFRLFR